MIILVTLNLVASLSSLYLFCSRIVCLIPPLFLLRSLFSLERFFTNFYPQVSLISCCSADVKLSTSFILSKKWIRHGGRETLREVRFIWPSNINVPLCIMYVAPKLTVSAWLKLLRCHLINKLTSNLIATKWICLVFFLICEINISAGDHGASRCTDETWCCVFLEYHLPSACVIYFN